MTASDRRHIAEWITDAFAIMYVRIGGTSTAERNIRLGFEAILRQFGTPPLTVLADAPPPGLAGGTTNADLRLILQALESCLEVYARYEGTLTMSDQRVQVLLRATHRCASEELQSRMIKS